MAHEITNRDQVFSVRQEMWHHLGVVLPEYPTREQAQRLVHPWEPVSEPVYRRVAEPVTQADGSQHPFAEVPGQVLNVRSDDGEPLGVVSESFTVVTNGEMYDVAEALEANAPGDVLYETGGSLAGGRKVWLLVRLKEPLVIKGDPRGETIAYYALQNAHDGSGSFRGSAVNTRIVCANTSRLADVEATARGTEFVFAHTKNVAGRIEEAKKALAGWREGLTAFQTLSAELVTIHVKPHQVEWFLAEFIPMPPPSTISDRVVTNVNQARDLVRGFLHGPTCEGINDTVYGLVQASQEYLNHARKAQSQESRFRRTYLEKSVFTGRVVNLARDAVNV
jgi:phage/plasmid-like protein (TIGR03299 family)